MRSSSSHTDKYFILITFLTLNCTPYICDNCVLSDCL